MSPLEREASHLIRMILCGCFCTSKKCWRRLNELAEHCSISSRKLNDIERMGRTKESPESKQRAIDEYVLSHIDSLVSKFLDDPATQGDLLCYYAKLKYDEFVQKG